MCIPHAAILIPLDQEMLITQLALDYAISECKPMLTPVAAHINLWKSADSPQVRIPVRQLVGSLFWIARRAHSEMMQRVVSMAHFCACYSRDHFLAVLCVLKHLNTVKHRKLTFKGGLSLHHLWKSCKHLHLL